MNVLKQAPQRTSTTYLCSQCRHAHAATKDRRRELIQRTSLLNNRIRDARKARREDWFLGPLAPNRAAADESYGCIEGVETRGMKGTAILKPGQPLRFTKGLKLGKVLIRVGDKVVVVAEDGPASRERGKVAKVTEVHEQSREVVCEDLNLVSAASFRLQSWIWQSSRMR